MPLAFLIGSITVTLRFAVSVSLRNSVAEKTLKIDRPTNIGRVSGKNTLFLLLEALRIVDLIGRTITWTIEDPIDVTVDHLTGLALPQILVLTELLIDRLIAVKLISNLTGDIVMNPGQDVDPEVRLPEVAMADLHRVPILPETITETTNPIGGKGISTHLMHRKAVGIPNLMTSGNMDTSHALRLDLLPTTIILHHLDLIRVTNMGVNSDSPHRSMTITVLASQLTLLRLAALPTIKNHCHLISLELLRAQWLIPCCLFSHRLFPGQCPFARPLLALDMHLTHRIRISRCRSAIQITLP